MSYLIADLDQILLHCDTRNIVSLTNDDDRIDPDNVALIDEDVLMAKENAAAQTVNNYLRYLYSDLPREGTGPEITEEIIEIVCNLIVVKLYERRNVMPDVISTLRDNTMERLARMAKMTLEVREGKTTKTPSDR